MEPPEPEYIERTQIFALGGKSANAATGVRVRKIITRFLNIKTPLLVTPTSNHSQNSPSSGERSQHQKKLQMPCRSELSYYNETREFWGMRCFEGSSGQRKRFSRGLSKSLQPESLVTKVCMKL